ncbi:TPA: hypothetical protein DIV49_02665 [Candidatus Saccharibacteria bacterium]|nr:hypothetical protein [Candidatus Saccharibacteria bacterium]HRJ91361.1 hypothetical protein [Candidatus Saccharibacteria bacterium]
MTTVIGEQSTTRESALIESVRVNRVRFARQLFARAISLDPIEVGGELVGRPTFELGDAVADLVLETSPSLDPDVLSKKEFLATGIDETSSIFDPYVRTTLKTQGIEAAKTFVTHPHSADAVARFAQRSQNQTTELIADADSWLDVSSEDEMLGYLTLDNLPAGDPDKRCPFAQDTSNERRRPLFNNFVGWAGLILVASKLTPRMIAHDAELRSKVKV